MTTTTTTTTRIKSSGNWPYQSNGVTTASRWSMLSQSGVGWRDAAHVSWRLQRHAMPTARKILRERYGMNV
jgi:hypothetical protein